MKVQLSLNYKINVLLMCNKYDKQVWQAQLFSAWSYIFNFNNSKFGNNLCDIYIYTR